MVQGARPQGHRSPPSRGRYPSSKSAHLPAGPGLLPSPRCARFPSAVTLLAGGGGGACVEPRGSWSRRVPPAQPQGVPLKELPGVAARTVPFSLQWAPFFLPPPPRAAPALTPSPRLRASLPPPGGSLGPQRCRSVSPDLHSGVLGTGARPHWLLMPVLSRGFPAAPTGTLWTRR